MTGDRWTTEGDGQRRARVHWTAFDRAVAALLVTLWLALVVACGLAGWALWAWYGGR